MPEDASRFWEGLTDIHKCPNPFGTLVGWGYQNVVGGGGGVVKIGELGNARLVKKDCKMFIDLEGGGEFARQATREEVKEG